MKGISLSFKWNKIFYWIGVEISKNQKLENENIEKKKNNLENLENRAATLW